MIDMCQVQQEANLKSLDDLIADLGGSDAANYSEGPCGLLLEHLQAARRDLLGAMLREYRLSLRQAEESTGCIPGKSARIKTRKILRRLNDSEVPNF